MFTCAANPTTATPVRIGDECLVRLTPAAAQRVRELLGQQQRPNGVLRMIVVGGGCSGLRYKVELQDAPAGRDILVETGGVRVVVDPMSVLYVTGSEVDYVSKAHDGGFKVSNPHLAPSCSCDELV